MCIGACQACLSLYRLGKMRAQPMTTTDTRGGIGHLLHHIRASVRELRSMALVDSQEFVEARLARQLRQALLTGSSYEIAVALASGAELQMYPRDDVMERCTVTVQASGHAGLRGIVWAVRHRCAQSKGHQLRFSIEAPDWPFGNAASEADRSVCSKAPASPLCAPTRSNAISVEPLADAV